MIRLTDENWERIRKHFPEENIPEGRPGSKPIPTRKVLEAVLWPTYGPDCPVVVVHRASQPAELVRRGTVATIADPVEEAGLRQAAVVLVGRALTEATDSAAGESWLYSADRPRT